MFERKGYVYRFVGAKNEILYVGKTVDMDKRMKQHFSSKSHLLKSGKGALYKETCKIEYIKCKDEYTALQKELYYINLYKPKYNTASKIRQIIDFNEATDVWKTYRVIREISKEQQLQNKLVGKLVPVVYASMFIAIVLSLVFG